MMGDSEVTGRQGGEPGLYASIAGYERFQLLRGRVRRAALVVGTVFLGWYFLYVGLSAFARDFMARTVVGHVNVALLLGVLQVLSTFALAWAYVAYARRRLDPLAGELR
ncbi:DUF485 domain-containing protein [Actinomadura sp. 7K534]|uniref:DUF485 domain-containing protein n=1 Tax=Actinomadura sp. 7K534 TaxID=2530366 RepID=UPI001053713A|nr:DUF485 domain-containing protein [Actinomadura sp. 7K534]TDB96773.1 DUF485 domain-containing protein [Actinomadura sp. 7K534]